LRYLVYIALLYVIIGCNPDGAGCFKSTGPEETVLVNTPAFTQIDVSSNIDVRIIPDNTGSITLTTGANLIPGIRIEVVEGILYLDNLNTCNFTRKYVNPLVEISTTDLKAITLHGFGNIVSTDTLRYDQLELASEGGSGEFRIMVNVRKLTVGSNNLANFEISGYADELSAGIYWSDCVISCENLKVKTAYVNHNGSNTIHLNVSNSISGSINNLGNVILHQQMPTQINVNETSNGKLIYNP